MPTLKSLLRNMLRKKRLEQDLDEELRFYVEELTQQGIAAGMSESEARRAARLELGSMESVKEAVREARTGAMMERIWQDFRYAVRRLWSKPGFTAAAVLILALGIGANSAVFSMVDAILLKPLSVTKPEELIGLYSCDTKHPDIYREFSYPNYVDIRDYSPVFSSLMAQALVMAGVKEGDRTRRTFTDIVSSNYFSTLGVSLFKGRVFNAEEERPGGELTVIVTYPYWTKTGKDPLLLGKKLRMNGRLFTIIGITPKGFTGTTVLLSPEMYVPLGAYSVVMNDFSGHGKSLSARDNDALLPVGRLKPGITRQAADAKLAVLASQMGKAFPAENKNWTLVVGPLSRPGINDRPVDDSARARVPSMLLLLLAGVVLLIASLNLANMMMAQGAVRRKEIAIRLAIGGGRRRIMQQLVTEGLILAILGGAAGLLFAYWGTTLLIGSMAHVAPTDLVFNAKPDVRVLTGTLVFCGLSTVIFGLFPAWKLSKPDLWLDLKETTGEDVTRRMRHLFSRSNMVVMAQLALSLVMLTAAGLFIHSALRAADVKLGFLVENEVIAEVDANMVNYNETQGRQLYSALRDRLRQIPGVQSVSMAATVPLGMRHMGMGITPVNSKTSGERQPLIAYFNIVTNDYFQSLNIPLLRGRAFTAAENTPESKSRVAIIDQLTASKLWKGGNAVGKQIHLNDAGGGQLGNFQVVGVVGTTRENILGGGRFLSHVYIPFGQQYEGDMLIHLKIANGGPAAESRMLDAIRHEIRATDARLPVLTLQTMREHLDSSVDLWIVRTGAHMLEVFGGVALFLAVIGLYAVNAYMVARRTREIGIRMAVGADASATLWMILGEGLRVTAVGLGIGLVLAVGAGQVLATFLYDVHGTDPVVLLAASLVLASSALLACYLPARRASRVDPMIALRYE